MIQTPLPNARPPSREILRANLIIERARVGFSQTTLADAAGITRQTVSEIERGVTNPTLDVLDKLCHALGTTPDRLLFLEVERAMDDDELVRRRDAKHEDSVGARELLAAIDEAAGRPARYSAAGRPPVRR